MRDSRYNAEKEKDNSVLNFIYIWRVDDLLKDFEKTKKFFRVAIWF